MWQGFVGQQLCTMGAQQPHPQDNLFPLVSKLLLTSWPEQYVTLATVPSGSRASPPVKQLRGGPCSSRREEFTTRSLVKEGARRPSSNRKEKMKSFLRALREQCRALQGGPPNPFLQMHASGAMVNWGTVGDRSHVTHPCSAPAWSFCPGAGAWSCCVS